jgi:hypothetical protein
MKVAQGVTTLEEVLRSTPEWEKPSPPETRPSSPARVDPPARHEPVASPAAPSAPPPATATSPSPAWRASAASRARAQLSELIGSGQFLTRHLDPAHGLDERLAVPPLAADADEATHGGTTTAH